MFTKKFVPAAFYPKKNVLMNTLIHKVSGKTYEYDVQFDVDVSTSGLVNARLEE